MTQRSGFRERHGGPQDGGEVGDGEARERDGWAEMIPKQSPKQRSTQEPDVLRNPIDPEREPVTAERNDVGEHDLPRRVARRVADRAHDRQDGQYREGSG